MIRRYLVLERRRITRKDENIAKAQRRVKCSGRAFASLREAFPLERYGTSGMPAARSIRIAALILFSIPS